MTGWPARGEYVRCLHEILIPCPFSFHSFTPISCWLPCNFNLVECHTICRKPNKHCKIPHYETSKNQKAFSFWGASPPDPLTRGSAPEPRWGLRPPTRYRLALTRSPYLCAPLKFILVPLGLKFWRRRWSLAVWEWKRNALPGQWWRVKWRAPAAGWIGLDTGMHCMLCMHPVQSWLVPLQHASVASTAQTRLGACRDCRRWTPDKFHFHRR